jgi:hypothetical protein
LVLDEGQATFKLRKLLVQVRKAPTDIRMERVQKADNTHHTKRNVLREFAVLEVFLNRGTDGSRVEAHRTKVGGCVQKAMKGDCLQWQATERALKMNSYIL